MGSVDDQNPYLMTGYTLRQQMKKLGQEIQKKSSLGLHNILCNIGVWKFIASKCYMAIALLTVSTSSIVKSTTSDMTSKPFFDVLFGLNQFSRVSIDNNA